MDSYENYSYFPSRSKPVLLISLSIGRENERGHKSWLALKCKIEEKEAIIKEEEELFWSLNLMGTSTAKSLFLQWQTFWFQGR